MRGDQVGAANPMDVALFWALIAGAGLLLLSIAFVIIYALHWIAKHGLHHTLPPPRDRPGRHR